MAKITVRGVRAVEAASIGAPLYVFNPQRGWIPAGPGALDRARRMLALAAQRNEGTHMVHIYGA